MLLVSQGHSLSDGLDDVQRAEMKAYMELVNNMLLTAEVRTHMYTHMPGNKAHTQLKQYTSSRMSTQFIVVNISA